MKLIFITNKILDWPKNCRIRSAKSRSFAERKATVYQPDRLKPPRPEDDLLEDERREDDEDLLDLRPEPKSGKPLGIIIDPPPIVRFLRRRRCSA